MSIASKEARGNKIKVIVNYFLKVRIKKAMLQAILPGARRT